MENVNSIRNTLFLILISAIVFMPAVISSCNKNDEKNMLAKIEENGCLNQGINATIGDCHLFMPNIFTPNSNQINDYFAVFIMFSDSTDFDCSLSVTITHIELGTIHTYQKSISDADHLGGSWQTLVVWNGKNSDNQIVPAIYQYEISGTINGNNFANSGELTLIVERTFLEYCQKCDPLNSGDPTISCAD